MAVPVLPVRSSIGARSALPQPIWHRAWIAEDSVEQDVAAARLLEVDRKCVVCEWTGTVQEDAETPEIAGQCPTCHAPTERLRVRRLWEHTPNVHAAALGRLGGLKGGPARAAALSPKRRREIARAAAAARWKRR
jgi:hypothetical protein